MRKTQSDRQAEATHAQQITEESIAVKLTAEQLAKKISCGLFADRDSLEEAFSDAFTILKNNPAGMTALYVVLNTVAKEIVKLDSKVVA